MKRRWRIKSSGPNSYNYWCTFEMTPEKQQLITDMNAIVFPLCELIMFKDTEDIIMFILKGGLNDIE